jgi:Xaa-Pro aminopeptidase
MSTVAPAYPEFDHAEFEARWERARAGMHARGLDALLVTTEANYRYLSGHATLAFMNRARPLFCLLPRIGAPLVLAGASESSVARNTSWVADVRAFTALVEPGVAELAQAVRDRGLATGRIGCELGLAQRLGMPPNDFRALQERLPGAAFIDGGDLLWALRRVKSAAEVTYLRRAATITSEAVTATLAAVRPGWTERDVYQHAATGVMRLGADRPGYGPVNADARAPDSMTGGPTARRLEPGAHGLHGRRLRLPRLLVRSGPGVRRRAGHRPPAAHVRGHARGVRPLLRDAAAGGPAERRRADEPGLCWKRAAPGRTRAGSAASATAPGST